MKNWKSGFRKFIVLVMTTALIVGSAGSYLALPVHAEEITAGDVGTAAKNTAEEMYDSDISASAEAGESSDLDGLNADNTEGKAGAEKQEAEESTVAGGQPKAADRTDISADDGAEEESVEEMVIVDELSELPDNDELLMGYIDQLFYGDMNAGISTYGNVGETRLTDANEKKMYSELKAAIKQIAAGTRTSTEITVSGLNISLEETKTPFKKAQAATQKVVRYLLMDCPYDFYWFDKTSYGLKYGYSDVVVSITFGFTVASGYEGNGEYVTNSDKTSAAKKAVTNAQTIVSRYAEKSDREKLTNYCNEICALTDYNYDAAENESTPYGNPWQLIWVFDDDETTKVVCEGYSKAFQYLCDLSKFSGNTICYTVSGTCGGPHMWNVVTLEGKNRLVDVTNSDAGTNSNNLLFLVTPNSGTVETGYTFEIGRNFLTYTYDSNQISLLGKKILSLSAPGEPEYDDTLPGTGTTQGTGTTPSTQPNTESTTKPTTGTNPGTTTKPAAPRSKSVTLSLNGQTLKNNTTLKATFSKKYTLKATVLDTTGKVLKSGNGKITWSTSNKKIATVNASGKVTMKKKAGTVTIMAKTADGKTAKVKLKVSKAAVKVTKVKITGSKTMSLKTKKTQALKATVTPATAANQKVTWKTSNKKIATVNSKGKVTAKKAGTVTITATAKDGSKKKASIKIKIKK